MKQQSCTPTFALILFYLCAFAALANAADTTAQQQPSLTAGKPAVAECFTEKADCTGPSQQVGSDVQWDAGVCRSVRPTNESKLCQGCKKNSDRGCQKAEAGGCVQLVQMTARNPLTCFMQ